MIQDTEKEYEDISNDAEESVKKNSNNRRICSYSLEPCLHRNEHDVHEGKNGFCSFTLERINSCLAME